MVPKLKNNLQVWKLATDLGLKPKDSPLMEILRCCQARIRSFLAEFPCNTLSELLEVAAAKLDTVFIEIHSDEELQRVNMEFLEKGETAFALLDKELAEEVYAITFKRQFIRNGERLYVSLIDCRGEKKWSCYFSKWHELAHLLTLTQQMRLKFCRTHAKPNTKDPEEAVMDAIAGEIGFLSNFLRSYTKGKVSFAKIREVREVLCPEASFQAAVIAFVKTWQSPCGYSLPEYDSFSVDFFNDVSRGKQVECWNPSDEALERFRRVFGDRAEHHRERFEHNEYGTARPH